MSKSLMKMLGLVLTLGLLAVACGSDSDGENAAQEAAEEAAADEAAEEAMADEQGDIVATAVETGQFPTLIAAVEAAGLVETLQGEGPFTVFAPTEDAFAAALDALGLTAEELLADTDTLATVLTYHVLSGEVPAETVVTLDGQSAATVQGEEIAIALDGDNVMVNDANVVTTDVFASNGVIHVIDTVLLPPTLVEALGLGAEDAMAEEEAAADIVATAVAAGEFPTLVAAVQAAGLVETLQGEGPFTVFAPTEDAFAAALDALGLTAEELLADTDTLTTVLTYHVIAGEVPAETVLTLDGQSAATVQGEEIAISIDGSNVMVNDSNVIATDVFASNGVIHVIDTVLLPPTVVEALGLGEEAMADEEAADIVGTAIAAGEFPTLIAAVEAAGLVETLQGEGPFTVFAPTEDAFAAALDQLGLTAEELLADTDTLTSVLTYHVVPGNVPAADVIGLDGQSVATVNGAEIGISIVDGNVVINDSTVVVPDVFASNGVIHVIDTVLLPPS